MSDAAISAASGIGPLSLLSMPTVLVLAPLLVGRHVERVTALVWGGAAAVITGSLVLVVDAP